MAESVPVEDVNEETPVKDSVISNDCNKLDPDAEVDVKTGLFLSPGKDPENILLLRNEKVIFVDHVQNRTVQHGNWHKWQKKMVHKCSLLLSTAMGATLTKNYISTYSALSYQASIGW